MKLSVCALMLGEGGEPQNQSGSLDGDKSPICAARYLRRSCSKLRLVSLFCSNRILVNYSGKRSQQSCCVDPLSCGWERQGCSFYGHCKPAL